MSTQTKPAAPHTIHLTIASFAPAGFAFGVNATTGESVFIPKYAVLAAELDADDIGSTFTAKINDIGRGPQAVLVNTSELDQPDEVTTLRDMVDALTKRVSALEQARG